MNSKDVVWATRNIKGQSVWWPAIIINPKTNSGYESNVIYEYIGSQSERVNGPIDKTLPFESNFDACSSQFMSPEWESIIREAVGAFMNTLSKTKDNLILDQKIAIDANLKFGSQIKIKQAEFIHRKLTMYASTLANIVEVPTHPNTWYGVKLIDGKIKKIRRSAFDVFENKNNGQKHGNNNMDQQQNNSPCTPSLNLTLFKNPKQVSIPHLNLRYAEKTDNAMFSNENYDDNYMNKITNNSEYNSIFHSSSRDNINNVIRKQPFVHLEGHYVQVLEGQYKGIIGFVNNQSKNGYCCTYLGISVPNAKAKWVWYSNNGNLLIRPLPPTKEVKEKGKLMLVHYSNLRSMNSERPAWTDMEASKIESAADILVDLLGTNDSIQVL